jgi:hypothetical protein
MEIIEDLPDMVEGQPNTGLHCPPIKIEYSYRFFCVSQGQGIALYFLNLCWVAQLRSGIITKKIIINMLEIFAFVFLMKFLF